MSCVWQLLNKRIYDIWWWLWRPNMELGHWVTRSVGHLGHHFDPVWEPSFAVFEKMPKMQNVHLKCWNDKSHCQVSIVGLKSLDVSPCNELVLLPMIIKNSKAWEYFFTHKLKSTFGVHYRTRWPGQLGLRVAGFPGHWVADSLSHKMRPSSISDEDWLLRLSTTGRSACRCSVRRASWGERSRRPASATDSVVSRWSRWRTGDRRGRRPPARQGRCAAEDRPPRAPPRSSWRRQPPSPPRRLSDPPRITRGHGARLLPATGDDRTHRNRETYLSTE